MRNKIIFVALLIVIIIVVIIVLACGNNKDKTIKKTYLYESKGLYGLENEEGEKITDAKYNKIIKIDNVDDIFIVVINNKYGLINSKGKEFVEVKYDSIVSDNYGFDYSNIGYILSLKTSSGYKFGYVNSKGKMLAECEYEDVKRVCEYAGEDVYLLLKENGRYGIFKNNKYTSKERYQDVFYNQAIGKFIVEKNGKYGVINIDGKIVIKPEYTMFGVDGDEIFFLQNDKMIYYDKDGKILRVMEKEV